MGHEGRNVESIKQNIIEILKKSSGDKEDIAYLVYNEMKLSEDDGAEVLCFFIYPCCYFSKCFNKMLSASEFHNPP